MRAPLLSGLLISGSVVIAQLPVVVQDSTTVRILAGTSVRTASNWLIDGPAARVDLKGVLELPLPDTSALQAFAGGGIVNEDSTGQGLVRWNMTGNGSYVVPFVNISGEAVAVHVRPAQTSAVPRMVDVSTYPTRPDNTPMPLGVTNTLDSAGQEMATAMADRYWVLWSTEPMIADVRLQWAPADDPPGGLDSLVPLAWRDTTWAYPAVFSADTVTRWMQLPGMAFDSAGREVLAITRMVSIWSGARLQLRMLLEGPYVASDGLMRDDLRNLPDFPLSEPYTALGLVQGTAGGEVLLPALLTNTGSDAVVDWVLVELRSSADPTQVEAQRCVLLQRDGDVMETDGAPVVLFVVPPGNYHVAIRHRNHLGAMTLVPVSFGPGIEVLDLSDGSVAMFGTDALKAVGPKWALYTGDVTVNGELSYMGADNDRDPILVSVGGTVPTHVTTGYSIEDVNLDGVVKYMGARNDRDPILVNIGGSVPTGIRLQQLP
ncbi:MAG: hypothetical protein JNM31_10730 [Flavobacteriales bacterium]|nr:hypothetical protein [Flavobacteriales bacterium]